MADSSKREIEDVLALLSDRHRRAVVTLLAEGAEEMDLDTLVTNLAKSDAGTDEDDLRLDLHHNHLPKLDGADWLEYHPQDRRVVPPDDTNAVVGSLDEALLEIDDLRATIGSIERDSAQ